MPPPMPPLSRRSDSDDDDNEPESTVQEGELLGVMSPMQMQQAPSPLQNTGKHLLSGVKARPDDVGHDLHIFSIRIDKARLKI